jgi:hypothetical protein
MAKPTHGCLCAPAYVRASVVLAVLGQIAAGESPLPEMRWGGRLSPTADWSRTTNLQMRLPCEIMADIVLAVVRVDLNCIVVCVGGFYAEHGFVFFVAKVHYMF